MILDSFYNTRLCIPNVTRIYSSCRINFGIMMWDWGWDVDVTTGSQVTYTNTYVGP